MRHRIRELRRVAPRSPPVLFSAAPGLPAPPSPTYELYAVCNHMGGIGSGHYVACAKHRTDGTWYQFNDSRCTPISESEVVSGDNYMLFFRAANAEAMPPHRQSLSSPQNWPFRLSAIPAEFQSANHRLSLSASSIKQSITLSFSGRSARLKSLTESPSESQDSQELGQPTSI